MRPITTVAVPNALGQDVAEVEQFYKLVVSAHQAHQYQFDMRAVTWVKPYGVIALVLAARHLVQCSGRPIQIQNLKEDIHLYLKRMDVLSGRQDWMQVTTPLSEEWLRNPQTANLLELTPITGEKDVETVVTRAERIFEHWLTKADWNNLFNVLSELCANIYQHSGDRQGCVLIQTNKLQSQGKRIVCLAVGDLGCGIQGSIVRRHGKIGKEPLDYLYKAIQGLTSRKSGRGGLGLRRVRQIAYESGGYIWLRSGTASIFSQAANSVETQRNLPDIPGTQLAVQLEAPLLA